MYTINWNVHNELKWTQILVKELAEKRIKIILNGLYKSILKLILSNKKDQSQLPNVLRIIF